MCRMSGPSTPEREGRYRRRFPLELTREESELLERAAAAHGTKRAAILAGLAALAELAERAAGAARSEQASDKAAARIAQLEQELAQLQGALVKSKDEASEDARTRRAGERARESEQKKLENQLKKLDRGLADAERSRQEQEAELALLEQAALDAAYCARCGQWAEPEEWEEKKTSEGLLVYHGPCGLHRGGLLEATSVFGLRLA